MPFLVDSVIFSVPVIPLFGPVLPDGVVRIVSLAPALTFSEAAGQIDLPFVTPFPAVVFPVDLAPFFMPFFLCLQILAPFLAR